MSAVLDIEDEADVRPFFPETATGFQHVRCAACGHKRLRHLQGKFECFAVIEQRTVLLQGWAKSNVRRECNCKEFV